MIALPAALLFAATAAGMAAEPGRVLIPVPSGTEVWLQESLTDPVPGMGLVQRYRFVMPKLAELVPPIPEGDLDANLPPDEMLDEPLGDDPPLTPAEQAELDAAMGDLVIEAVPADGAGDSGAVLGGIGGDGAAAGQDGPLPFDLAAPDAALPEGSAPDSTAPDAPLTAPDGTEGEASSDLAAIAAGEDGVPGGMAGDAGVYDPALPAAPDLLMQDPTHRDIVWLCETFALPQIARQKPRPTQVVISMASAPSPFGSFDPNIVQLFEGFSIPKDRDACIWEPM